jgi:hypothetical protein
VTGLIGGLMQAMPPVHVLAIISVALSAARSRLWPGFGFVAAFAAGLAAGLVTLALGAGETSAADVLLAVVLLSSLAAVAAVTVPRRVVECAAFIVGYGLGLDSPPDAILLRDAILSLAGTWCPGGDVPGGRIRGGDAAGAAGERNCAAGRRLLDRGDGDSGASASVGSLEAKITI